MNKSTVRFLYNLTLDKKRRICYNRHEVIKMGRPKKEGGLSPTDYKREFNEKNYDRLAGYVRRGKKDRYKAAAAAMGCSMNKFMEQAMDKLAAEVLGEEMAEE